MSYNRSLNSDSNYPLMSQSEWDSAPFNEPVVPERNFDLTISQSLSKSVSVYTSQYCLEYDDEDGNTYVNTEDTDWNDVFENSDYHTPMQLIELFGQYLQKEVNCNPVLSKKEIREYNHLIKECSNWIVDETEIIES